VRSLLLFYSQIVGDYPTLVAEYVAEGSYRAAIGMHPFALPTPVAVPVCLPALLCVSLSLLMTL
jgi:hypothetical protein